MAVTHDFLSVLLKRKLAFKNRTEKPRKDNICPCNNTALHPQNITYSTFSNVLKNAMHFCFFFLYVPKTLTYCVM